MRQLLRKPAYLRSNQALLHLLSSNVGGNLLGFFSGVVAARALGVEGRGQYQMAAILFSTIPGTLTLSLGTAVVVQQHAPRDSWRRKVIVAFTALGSIAVMVAGIFKMVPMDVAAVLAIGSIGYMSSDLYQGLLRRQGDYPGLAIYRWVDIGGGAALIIGMGLIGILSVPTAVGALCLSTVIAVSYVSMRWRRGPRESQSPFEWRMVPSIHTATLIRIASSWSDQIIVGLVLGSGPLGLYAIANSMASQFMVLPSAINTVLLKASADSFQHAAQKLSKYFAYLFWAAAAGSILMVTVGPLIMSLVFGDAFSESAHIAALLLAGYLLSGLVLLSETFLVGAGRSKFARTARLWSLPSITVGCLVSLVWPSPYTATAIPILGNLVPLVLLIGTIRNDMNIPLKALVGLSPLTAAVRPTSFSPPLWRGGPPNSPLIGRHAAQRK